MKFFISIIMVLLMLNLFAQAEEATPEPEGPTAVPVVNSATKKVITPGDAYQRTVTGIPADGNQAVQGQQKPVEKKDACGKCDPTPNKGTVANKRGTYVKGKNGKPPGVTPATAGKTE